MENDNSKNEICKLRQCLLAQVQCISELTFLLLKNIQKFSQIRISLLMFRDISHWIGLQSAFWKTAVRRNKSKICNRCTSMVLPHMTNVLGNKGTVEYLNKPIRFCVFVFCPFLK